MYRALNEETIKKYNLEEWSLINKKTIMQLIEENKLLKKSLSDMELRINDAEIQNTDELNQNIINNIIEDKLSEYIKKYITLNNKNIKTYITNENNKIINYCKKEIITEKLQNINDNIIKNQKNIIKTQNILKLNISNINKNGENININNKNIISNDIYINEVIDELEDNINKKCHNKCHKYSALFNC